MLLFFDTETTGIFDFKKAADADGQPRMCAIAAVLTNDEGTHEFEHVNELVRPDGWTVPEDVAKIHGLTTEILEEHGSAVEVVLYRFLGLYKKADRVLGFGVDFDLKMLRGELRRASMPDRYGEKPKEDVMRLATPICKIPPTDAMMRSGRKWFKTPKLSEAYEIILGEKMEGAHNALADVRATVEVWRALKAGVEPARDGAHV